MDPRTLFLFLGFFCCRSFVGEGGGGTSGCNEVRTSDSLTHKKKEVIDMHTLVHSATRSRGPGLVVSTETPETL